MKKQKIFKIVAVLVIVAGIAGYFYWKDQRKKAEIARQEQERIAEEQRKLAEIERTSIKPRTETGKITTIPEQFYLGYVMSGNKINEIKFSPNGGGVAYKVVKDGQAFIVINDKEGKHYEDVGRSVFSPDSQQVSYPAKNKLKWIMVSGEKESKPIHDYVDVPTYSPNGKIFSYFARSNRKWFVVSNDAPGRSYEFSGNYSDERHLGNHLYSDIIYSPDNQKMAFVVGYAQTIKDEKNKLVTEKLETGQVVNKLKIDYFVSVNGQDGEKYDKIAGLAFSPDSQKLTYGAEKGGKWYLVTNSEEQGPYNYAEIFSLVYGSDNSTMAKVVALGGRTTILSKDRTIDAPNYIPGSRLVLAPDNETTAYAAKKGDKYFVVYGERSGEELDYIDSNSIRFSEDGTKVMYGGLKGNELWWMVDSVK